LIQVIDASTRTIERTINSCGGMPRRIAFGLSGSLAVIADEEGADPAACRSGPGWFVALSEARHEAELEPR
jgi:hypothetical protein